MSHAIGVALERLDGEFGAGGREGEVVLEEIVVPVDVRDGQDLQRRASCRA